MKRTAALQSGLELIHSQYEQSGTEIDKLRAENSKLELLLIDAGRSQEQPQEAAANFNS